MTEADPSSARDATDQIDESVQHLAALHEREARRLGPIQKIANRTTYALGRPSAVVVVVVLIMLWVIGNALAPVIGDASVDRFPFPDLALFATVSAFLVTLLILTTQRHEQDVARKRDQLTLHVAMLSEKKIAKVIALLEEQRRDNPLLSDREDHNAAEMAQPADPGVSLDRIEASDLA